MLGKKYQLPITCIVDEKGNLNKHAEKFCGLNVLRDANDLIIEDLEKNNLLLLKENINIDILMIGELKNLQFLEQLNNGLHQ